MLCSIYLSVLSNKMWFCKYEVSVTETRYVTRLISSRRARFCISTSYLQAAVNTTLVGSHDTLGRQGTLFYLDTGGKTKCCLAVPSANVRRLTLS